MNAPKALLRAAHLVHSHPRTVYAKELQVLVFVWPGKA
jgi:hypothetical protein